MTTAEAVIPPQTTAETEASRQKTASLANSYRVTAVAERLAVLLQSGGITNPTEFFGLCLSLARGIDFAVANAEVPTRAEDLPPLLKKICNYRQESFLQAAVMALMVSVKSACKNGWFQEQTSQELCALANEIASSFCSPRDINAGESDPHPVIPIVMSKFYPLLKMGDILASLVVKPGYGGFVVDFQITKAVKHSNNENIRLFVVQTDNTESSACLISPPQVSFLLNGKGVDRRTNVFMDMGPLMPSNVTALLKYGTNLLQAVGQFNAHYYIAVAFARVMPLPENPTLMDYLHVDSTALDPDSDIIEGPFRISLNCPISYKRIKTPVKGHSCKHLQCFDFSNYVDINSRRPSWRCPHCNQHVCYTDIRVDQNMVKVLSEVGDDISEVIITADGSWKAVLDNDDSMEAAPDKILSCPKQGSDPQDSMHVDLTADDDMMDAVGASEIEDIKPVVLANLQNQPVAASATQPSQLSNANAINQSVAGIDMWSSAYFAHQSVASNARFAGQVVNGTYASVPPSIVMPNSSAPLQNSTTGGHSNSSLSPVMTNQVSAADNSQLQQSPFVNSVSSNEYGRIRQIPAHINRNPIAVQALPVPSQTPSPQQRPRASVPASPITPQTTTMASAGNTASAVSSGMNRQHPFPGPHLSQLQNRNIQGQSVQQTGGVRTSSPVPGSYRPSARLAPQMPLPRSHSPTLGQSSPLSRTPAQSGSPVVGSGTSTGTSQYAKYSLSAERALQMARPTPSVPIQNQASRTVTQPSVAASGTRTPTTEQTQKIPAAAGISSASSPSEQDWRPAGRMRGSLSGRNFDAYKDYLIQPSQASRPAQPAQPSQASRPAQPTQPSQPRPAQPTQPLQPIRPAQPTQPLQPSRPAQPTQPSQPPRISNLTSPPTRAPQGNLASHPTSVPPHLQSRNRNVNASQSQNNPTT